AEAEQVDLHEAGVGARVLVPLTDLAAGHRRRLHRHELDERPRGDDHPAGVLGDVAREACDLLAEPAQGAPPARGELRLRIWKAAKLLLHPVRVSLCEARESLELGEWEAERLAEVADRPASGIGGERGHERTVLAAV